MPAWHAQIVCSVCQWFGVASDTASIVLSSSNLRKSLYTAGRLPDISCTSCALLATTDSSTSQSATISTFSSGPNDFRCTCPRVCSPTQANRTVSFGLFTRVAADAVRAPAEFTRKDRRFIMAILSTASLRLHKPPIDTARQSSVNFVDKSVKPPSNRPSRRSLLAAGSALALRADAPPSGRIDCQSHLFVPELLDWMEKRKTTPYVFRQGNDRFVVVNDWKRRILPKHTDVKAKIADMDAAGIALTALSINDPGPELFGKDGPAIARMVHDFLGTVAAENPGRFFGLMTLPLDDMDASLRELDRCVSRWKMKGILLYSNLDGHFPDEPQYAPLFAEAERRGLPVLLHPACPVTYKQTSGYEMAAGLGLMFDTTIALARIILSGLLDKHPNLKLVCPHVGGTLPYIVGRVDHQTMVLKRGAEHITKAPSDYLRHIWFDAVSPLPMAIRYGIDFAGPDRMLYSSDHPWVDPKLIANGILSLKLGAETEQKVFSTNARRLFQL